MGCLWPLPPGFIVLANGGVPCELLYLGLCFLVPDDANIKGGIFGFSEFVQAFALLILIYTMSDVRYRFRAATAPIPLWSITFWVSGFIGLGTLLSDLWFAKKYPVPWFLINQPYWQLFFGFLFLSVVMLWLWYAFIRPPIFGRLNPENFIRQLSTYVLQGGESDLPVVASELRRSAYNIVKYAPGPPSSGRPDKFYGRAVAQCAHDILLVLASRKFCRHIMASAPLTAIAFFRAMSDQGKYNLPIGTFASNISTEALRNKDSILFHEDEGYISGYFGYVRPFTNALYGDFWLVETLTRGRSPLDVDLDFRWTMDGEQLEAYTRAVLTTFKAALEEDQFYNNSFALNRAFEIIQSATNDLYKLDEVLVPAERDDIGRRLTAAVSFINRAIEALEKYGVQDVVLRRRGPQHHTADEMYDHLADMMFEIVGHAAAIKTKEMRSWDIQHNGVWSRLFNHHHTPTRAIILFKLRRRLYEEVTRVGNAPNFLNVKYFGYLLNVLGVSLGEKRRYSPGEYQLAKVVIALAKRKYVWLSQYRPKLAAAVLMGTISYDAANRRLVKTYIEGLNTVAPTDTLDLDSPEEPIQEETDS